MLEYNFLPLVECSISLHPILGPYAIHMYKIFLDHKNMENEIGKTFGNHAIPKQMKNSHKSQRLELLILL